MLLAPFVGSGHPIACGGTPTHPYSSYDHGQNLLTRRITKLFQHAARSYIRNHVRAVTLRPDHGVHHFRSSSIGCLPRRTDVVGANPTRQLSLQPEAPGADQEATNGLKHFGKRSLLGISGPCGPQHKRTPLRPRKDQCESRPASGTGRSPSSGKRARHAPDGLTGVKVAARMAEHQCATREVCFGDPGRQTGRLTASPRGSAPVEADGGWVRITVDAG